MKQKSGHGVAKKAYYVDKWPRDPLVFSGNLMFFLVS